MAVRGLAGPNESSACRPVFPALRSGTQVTSGNGLTGLRNPQNPMDAHLRVNRKNPLSPHSVSFRPSRLPTSGTLRNRTSPRLYPRHASPHGAVHGPPAFSRAETHLRTKRRDGTRAGTKKVHAPNRSAPHRTGTADGLRKATSPPVRVRRRPKEKPETTALCHDASARRTSGELSATQGRDKKHTAEKRGSAARVPSKGDSISRHAERTYLPPPPDAFRSRSVRTRTGCGRERIQSGNAACGCASGHSNPKNAIGHVDPSKHILSVFSDDGLCLFVFNSATIRRGGFGGHPVNG